MTPEERIALERKRYVRRRYVWCVEHHECVNCRAVDARTLAGHTRCQACNDRAYRSVPAPTDESRAEDARRKRERRQRRGEERACRQCGRQDYLTLRGRPLCAACQRRRNENDREYRQSGRLAAYQKRRRDGFREAGLCTRCGKSRPEEGKRMCVDCRVREKLYRLRKKQAEAQRT